MGMYEARQIYRVVDAGPGEGVEVFRLRVSGKVVSKVLNVSEEQLRRIAAVLDDENPSDDVTL